MKQNIFKSLKNALIGRIDDNDILLIKDGLHRLKRGLNYTFEHTNGIAKIIYYQFNKSDLTEANQQWHRIKQCVDNATSYVFGSNDAYYINHGKCIKYYKFFRYCPKYNMLELVSDYYNKIPIFYHLSDGNYEVKNGIELIKGIDY